MESWPPSGAVPKAFSLNSWVSEVTLWAAILRPSVRVETREPTSSLRMVSSPSSKMTPMPFEATSWVKSRVLKKRFSQH